MLLTSCKVYKLQLVHVCHQDIAAAQHDDMFFRRAKFTEKFAMRTIVRKKPADFFDQLRSVHLSAIHRSDRQQIYFLRRRFISAADLRRFRSTGRVDPCVLKRISTGKVTNRSSSLGNHATTTFFSPVSFLLKIGPSRISETS